VSNSQDGCQTNPRRYDSFTTGPVYGRPSLRTAGLLVPFWCRLTQIVPDEIQEGRKMVMCGCVHLVLDLEIFYLDVTYLPFSACVIFSYVQPSQLLLWCCFPSSSFDFDPWIRPRLQQGVSCARVKDDLVQNLVFQLLYLDLWNSW